MSEIVLKEVEEAETFLEPIFKQIEAREKQNSEKVLSAFQKYHVEESDFYPTTGYGYNDSGRDKIEKVFSDVLDAEDALVRSQFISGSHALTVALFAYLRPGDTMLSITGKPYDTLDEVIGLVENASSLASFGVMYEQIDLVDNDFNYADIKNRLQVNPPRLIEIQRSRGYATRESLTISKLEKVISLIHQISPSTIVMVDNCYCEFVEEKTPLTVGADIIVGSLIKNLGGGIAPNGAYIAGKKELVELAAERLTLPGEGREVGPSLGINKQILMGLFFAPSVVASSLKTAVLTSYLLEKNGYDVSPKYNEERADIVETITFRDREKLISYCEAIQGASPIDSFVTPVPAPMPGYQDEVIMASGSFTQGSSIELSCDGPLREPYIAYQQGSLTYAYGRLAVLKALSFIK